MERPQDDLDSTALISVAGYLAQRSNVCAKIIDRHGAVIAINQRGLELLDSASDDVCGQVWAQFWEGEDREAATTAVEIGFAGKPCEFIGSFLTGGTRSAWEVEILPLVWEAGAVRSVLVLSTRLGAQIEGAPQDAPPSDVAARRGLGEAFRRLTAAARLSTQVAAQLRDGVDGGDTRVLADQLEATGRQAEQAAEDLAALLQINPHTAA